MTYRSKCIGKRRRDEGVFERRVAKLRDSIDETIQEKRIRAKYASKLIALSGGDFMVGAKLLFPEVLISRAFYEDSPFVAMIRSNYVVPW